MKKPKPRNWEICLRSYNERKMEFIYSKALLLTSIIECFFLIFAVFTWINFLFYIIGVVL